MSRPAMEVLGTELNLLQPLEQNHIRGMITQLFGRHLVGVARWGAAVACQPAATRGLRRQEQIVVAAGQQ
jgi:hypothetical protein